MLRRTSDGPKLISLTPAELERLIAQRLHEHHQHSDGVHLPQRETIDMLSRSRAPLVPASPRAPPDDLRLSRGRSAGLSAQAGPPRNRLAVARDRGATSGCDFHSAQILGQRRSTFNGPDGASPTTTGAADAGAAVATVPAGTAPNASIAGIAAGHLPRGGEMSLSTPSMHAAAPLAPQCDAQSTRTPAGSGAQASAAGEHGSAAPSARGGGGRLPRGGEMSLSTPLIHAAASVAPDAPPRGHAPGAHHAAHAAHTPPTHHPPTSLHRQTSADAQHVPGPEALLLGFGPLPTIRDTSRRGIELGSAPPPAVSDGAPEALLLVPISRENSRKGIDISMDTAPRASSGARSWLVRLSLGARGAEAGAHCPSASTSATHAHAPSPTPADVAAAAVHAARKDSTIVPFGSSGARKDSRMHLIPLTAAEPVSAGHAWRRALGALGGALQLVVMHPYSRRRLRWERIIFAAVMLTVIEAPFYAAFLETNATDSSATSVLTIFIDLLIGADVYVNLLTGYVSDDANAVEMGLVPIARHYARSWLLLDVIAAWPVRCVALMATGSANETFSTIVRVGRLARCLKAPLVMRTLRRNRNSLLVVVVLAYLIAMHWFTCLQWALPRAMGYPPDSWPIVTGTINETTTRRYIQTAFNTISQMASIGYGNYQPNTDQELITTVFNIVLGNACFGLLVSAFAVKLSSTDSCTRAHDERVEAMNHYLALTAMPVELRQRVRAHLLAQFPTNKLYDEEAVLSMLPFQVRRDLNLVRARTLYQKVPLFRVGGVAFMVQVSQHLRPQHALPGEYLLHEGEPIVWVSFIDEGAVEVLVGPDLELVAELHDGEFLGESACVRERVCAITTARVLQHSVIFSIRGSALREILGRFPDAKLAVMHVINSRLDVLDRRRPRAHGTPYGARAAPQPRAPQPHAPMSLAVPPAPATRRCRSASFS